MFHWQIKSIAYFRMFTGTLSKLFIAIIKVYQNFISPVLPARCRYYPTCSEYAKTAIRWHGPFKGGLMTLKRLSSCHPFGGSGIDFVPLPLYKDIFYPLSNHPSSNPLSKSISDEEVLMTASFDASAYFFQYVRIIERGVYKDVSSYSARLNAKLGYLYSVN